MSKTSIIKKFGSMWLFLSVISFSIAYPRQVDAEISRELIDVLPVATGTVVGITENGEMIVTDTNLSDDPAEEFIYRQWALQISPNNMELLSLGRFVTCEIYYTSPKRVIGDCLIKIARGSSAPPRRHYMSVYSNQSAIALDADEFSLGSIGCSSEDRDNLPHLRFEYREFVLCPELLGISKE